MDKSKLQKILDGMNSESGLSSAFKSVENEIRRVTAKMKRDAELQASELTKKSITELKSQIQEALESLKGTFKTLEDELVSTEEKLSLDLEDKLSSLRTAISNARNADSQDLATIASQIETLESQIKEIGARKIEIPDFGKDIKNLEIELGKMIFDLKESQDEELKEMSEDCQKKLDALATEIKKLRSDAMSRLGSHGGQANRNIMVGGNSSTLGRYTDINLKAGSNVTLTYTNNDTLKTTDITIAGSGGGDIASVGITIDGGGAAITTGIKGYIEVPYACTINRVTMLADVSGAIVVDIWNDTYANFPPTDADSITASAPPTITASGVKSQDSTLTGWDKDIAAGDILAFNVDSVTSITRLNLILKVTKV